MPEGKRKKLPSDIHSGHVSTPSGPTPAELRQKAQKTSRKRVTRRS
jgi:hypothetical protein